MFQPVPLRPWPETTGDPATGAVHLGRDDQRDRHHRRPGAGLDGGRHRADRWRRSPRPACRPPATPGVVGAGEVQRGLRHVAGYESRIGLAAPVAANPEPLLISNASARLPKAVGARSSEPTSVTRSPPCGTIR